MADNEVELAGRPRTGRARKACATCRRAKRRCTHTVEGLEESGLVALTSGPHNKAADQTEVNFGTSGFLSPSPPSSPFPQSSSSHAASSAAPPLSSEDTITMANKKKNNKRGLLRAPKGANDTNTTEAGVEKTPGNTTTVPAAPASPAISAAHATSGPIIAATIKKSANQKRKDTAKEQATTTINTTNRPSTAASRARIPDLPEDAPRAAVAMSVHRVYARELQRLLDQFEIQFRTLLETEGPKPAMEEAWEAVRETGDTIQVTVEEWVTKWSTGA